MLDAKIVHRNILRDTTIERREIYRDLRASGHLTSKTNKTDNAMLRRAIDDGFIYGCGRFDGSRDARHLVREVKKHGVLRGILEAKPGLMGNFEGVSIPNFGQKVMQGTEAIRTAMAQVLLKR